ncbi:MAG: peptidoglycan editing factor PgeF [Pseudomonadota bacterium]
MIGWIDADWDAQPGIVAGTTTRTGGVSKDGYASLNLGAHVDDDPASVAANRARLVEALKLDAEPRWLQQVHGRDVAHVDTNSVGVPSADASVTSTPGVPLVIMTADCLPVLVVNRAGTEIAAAHGGWRGLADGVLAATVARLQSSPADLLAWLGPAISQPRFEVGGEVREAFVRRSASLARCFEANTSGRYQADLYGIARQQLLDLGVGTVSGGGFCTHTDSEHFFSHRRNPRCGRMASVIMIPAT